MQKDEGGPVTLTREELYEQVWTTPIARLATEYGMSDRGLAKLCERFRIPRSGRGYWAKRQHGQKVRRTPLPRLKDSRSETVRLYRQPYREPATLEVDGTIIVPEVLADPHPLIVRTEKSLRSARVDEEGLVSPRAKRALRVRMAPASIDRAMRILDTLVKDLEERGFKVEARVDDRGRPETVVVVDGEAIEFRLTEKLQRVERKPEEEEVRQWRRRRRATASGKYDYRPAGALTLEILTRIARGVRTKWSDLKKTPLEQRLEPFVATLVLASDTVKRRRREEEEARRRREAYERERAEKLRQIREEEQRLEQLEAEVEAWHRSQRIRAFVDAVRETASPENGQDGKEDQVDEWIAWATSYADRFDPLVEAAPSILDEKEKWRYPRYW